MEWFCWAALDSVASPVGLTSQALIGPAAYAKTLAVSDSFAKKGRLSGIGDHLTMREPAIISCADAASVLPVPPQDARPNHLSPLCVARLRRATGGYGGLHPA